MCLRRMISRLGAARAEFCHSGKKFPAMTKRKPQLFEVLLAQIRRYVQIDVVSRQRRRRTFQGRCFFNQSPISGIHDPNIAFLTVMHVSYWFKRWVG